MFPNSNFTKDKGFTKYPEYVEFLDIDPDILERGLVPPSRIQITKDNTGKDLTTFRWLMLPKSCTEHSDMFLLEDEKLVMPGDKFESHDHFVQYINENSKRWNYYYSCHHSYQPHTEHETYTYRCIYNGKNYNRKVENRVRKRNNSRRTNCPCTIKLKRLPFETEVTAIYVCNHHNHDLSPEQFLKLQHGRRLPAHIKEEIVDFILLQVDRTKIRKYVQTETGLDLCSKFFYNIKRTLEQNKNTREITEERLKILNEKIAAVDHLVPIKKPVDPLRKKYPRSKRKPKTVQQEQSIDNSDGNELNAHTDEGSSPCEIQTIPWVIEENAVVLEKHEDDDLGDNNIEYMQCENEYMEECINDIESPATGDDVDSQTNEHYLDTMVAEHDLSMNTEQIPDIDDTDDFTEVPNVNKCIQTVGDGVSSDNEETQNEMFENVQLSNNQNVDMYKKYDYVHKHNIGQYLMMPDFSKYINILAKNIGMTVLDMLTNIYNEVAQLRVFKKQTMTDCKIVLRYRKQTGTSKKINVGENNEDLKKQKLGSKLQKKLILKEKIRKLKEYNNDLVKENAVYKNSLLELMTSELN